MAGSTQSYLETQVMTAAPQKLRLMLIEGALRLANRARDLLSQNQLGPATESILRCQTILDELGASPDPQRSPELARQISSLYRFVHRSLTDAQLNRDLQRLNDSIRVLEIERETWRLVCQKLDRTPMPHFSVVDSMSPALEGLSLEA